MRIVDYIYCDLIRFLSHRPNYTLCEDLVAVKKNEWNLNFKFICYIVIGQVIYLLLSVSDTFLYSVGTMLFES